MSSVTEVWDFRHIKGLHLTWSDRVLCSFSAPELSHIYTLSTEHSKMQMHSFKQISSSIYLFVLVYKYRYFYFIIYMNFVCLFVSFFPHLPITSFPWTACPCCYTKNLNYSFLKVFFKSH